VSSAQLRLKLIIISLPSLETFWLDGLHFTHLSAFKILIGRVKFGDE